MTEAEWLASDSLYLMLRLFEDMASNRQLQLFGCACCRSVWDRLPDPRSQRAVEAAERYIEGEATAGELEVARRAAEAARLDASAASRFDAGEGAAVVMTHAPDWSRE